MRTIQPSAAREATIVPDLRGESIKSLIIVLLKGMAYDTKTSTMDVIETKIWLVSLLSV